MTFSSFLIEYTLITVFNCNKGAYAHAISTEERSFRKAVRRAGTGKDNSTISNRTMDMDIRNGIDPVPVVEEFRVRSTYRGKARPECAFYFYINRAKQKLEKYEALVGDHEGCDLTFQHVSVLLANIDSTHCGNNPTGYHICKFFHEMGDFDDLDERIMKNCPCKRADEMINALCIAVNDE